MANKLNLICRQQFAFYIMTETGRQLRELREQQNITLVGLSNILMLNPKRLENGHFYNPGYIGRLAAYFNKKIITILVDK